MEKDFSIKDVINSSLEQIRTIVDADTVVGKQIVTPDGTVIIPISKVSMGFASGGLDVPSAKNNFMNFGAGGGTGVTVSPIGFLVVSPKGGVEMLPLNQEKATPIEQIADVLQQTPEIINRVKSVFTNQSADEAAREAETLELEYEAKLREIKAQKKKAKKEKN